MFADGVRYFAQSAVRRQLEAEIHAQFAAFRRTGLALDHVNSHKHFHLHPTLLGMIVRIGREFGLRAVRVPHEPFWFSMRCAGGAGVLTSAFTLPLVATMKWRLRRHEIKYNDHVFGISGSGSMDENALLAILARLPPGASEIYMHPARGPPTSISPLMLNYRHGDELHALLSPRVISAVKATRADRGGYRDLVRMVGR